MEFKLQQNWIKIFIHLALILQLLDFSDCNRNSQIPFSVFKKQSSIKSTRDFVNEMLQQPGRIIISGAPPSNRKTNSESTRTGASDISESAGFMQNNIATPDVCEPRPMSVPIPPDENPRVMYWPTCTKLEQCGGCCGHDLLECAPTRTEAVGVQVMKQMMSTEDSNHFNYMGNVRVTLQRHLSCECRCKMKPHECTAPIQVYDEANCICRCRNSGQAASCQVPKIWDETHCRCVCRNLTNCLDGEYFDFRTCSCVRSSPQVMAQPGGYSINPISGYITCRAGMVARHVANRCQCRRSRIG